MEITFLAIFLSGVQSLRIFRLIFSRVSIVGRTPLPLKRHREQAGPGHFVMSLLTAYLVAHAPCSTALIDAIAAERVPKPRERENTVRDYASGTCPDGTVNRCGFVQ